MRTLYKALTYRVLSLCVTAGLGYTMTGSITAALSFGAVDAAFKMGLYSAHEAAWNKITRVGLCAAATAAVLALGRLAVATDETDGDLGRLCTAAA